jgi:hypothetical protein
MQSFKLFFEHFRNSILEESLQSRIDELVGSNVFGALGEDFIQQRFEEYKTKGVVPTERLNTRKSDRTGLEMIELTEKDYEEILPFVFKMDKEVRDKVIELAKGDDKKSGKINKFYNGLTVRPVFEDASQIKGTLTNWFVFRNKDNDVPKSLRSKIDFGTLEAGVDKALAEQNGEGDDTKKSGGDPDYNKPDGFSFIREVNNMRLYKWNSIGTVCSLDPTVKKDWLSIKFDVTGNASNKWCVAGDSGEYRDQYGEPDDKGDFKYPYYMVRKKGDGGYRPYVLMHGETKQCKDINDHAIDEELAEEIYPAVQGMLKQIIFNNS